jgi:hypothetical protein
MKFNIKEAIPILERTPTVVGALLSGLPESWTMQNEGPDTWSPFDIVGHLIHGEKTDWMPRLEIILADGDKAFVPFDRFAQYENSKGKTLQQLLDEFTVLRMSNLEKLRSHLPLDAHLNNTGIHPTFGEVTLRQLLSTWVVHDLNHIYQITRVMSSQYKDEVGPWVQFLRILKS